MNWQDEDGYERDRLEPSPIEEILQAEWDFWCYRITNNETGGYKRLND